MVAFNRISMRFSLKSTGHDVSSSRQNTAMFIGGIPLIILGSFMQTILGAAGLLFNDSSSGHADEVQDIDLTQCRLASSSW